MTKWKSIKSAPKDGSLFLAKIGAAVYVAYYDKYDKFVWIMHDNTSRGATYKVHKKLVDSTRLLEEIKKAEEPNYKPRGHLWIAGFEDKPTHWLPLPPLPKT